MKLVYLWIQELNNYINVDFNLGSDYFFKFNSEINTLKVTNNDFYIENIYNNHSEGNLSLDCNAIVGENGTGKTTIMESIRNIVLNKYKGRYLLVYKNGDTYTYKAPHKIKIDSPKLTFKVEDGGVPKINSFYYSNVFDSRYIANIYNTNKLNEDKDYTTNMLMRKSNDIYEFFGREFSMQVDFVREYAGLTIESKFKIPEELYIKLNFNHIVEANIPPDLLSAIDEITKFHWVNKIFNNELSKNPSYYIYSKSVVLFNIYSIINHIRESNLDRDIHGLLIKLTYSISEILDNLEFVNLNQNQIFDIVFENIYTRNVKNKVVLEKKELLDLIGKLQNYNKSLYVFLYKNESTVLLKNSIKTSLNLLNNNLIDIFLEYQKMNLGSFEWYNLSSGEYAILSMLSRIYHAAKQIEKKPDPNLILICIDEGELYFHPQWQKEFITILLKYLAEIFKQHQVHIQVLLTTHSPFILSDLTLDRVLFLQKNENEKVESVNQLENLYHTFGANIHDLYTHSFFLKGSLMGNQAKYIINRLADEIINETPEYLASKNETIRRKIHAIGEPLLKQKLTLLYEQKLKLLKPTQIEIKNEIDMLKQRLHKLEQLKGEIE